MPAKQNRWMVKTGLLVAALWGAPVCAETPSAAPPAPEAERIAQALEETRKRAFRKRFDAEAEAPCAQEQGAPLGTCQIGVARGDAGVATVSATFGNGFSRLLFFTSEGFMRGNATMSGVGTDMAWQLVDGIYRIRVDDQRFEIPRGFVTGR